MEQILAGFLDQVKGKQSLIEIEQALFTLVMAAVCAGFGELMTHLDDQLFASQGGKCLRKDNRTITCLFGAITFKRRLIERQDGSHVYLLDEKLGLAKRKRYSPLLFAKVSLLASKGPYRTISTAINTLTPFSVSHQMLAKIVKDTGSAINEVKKAEADFPEETPTLRKVPVLYIEGDAFEVRLKSPKGKKQHGSLRQMVHRFQVFEGVDYRGKRHLLVHRYQVANTKRAQAMHEIQAYLMNHYDLRKTQVITSSDNGSGYEPEVFGEFAVGADRHVHILDRYHMGRKLKERLPNQPEMGKLLRDALYRGDDSRIEVILDTAESRIITNDEEAREATDAIHKLHRYLERNWDYIAPLSDRSLRGQLSGLGSCESNHRKFTYRLKKQGKSWSKAGLDAMLRIITAEQNNEYQSVLIKAGRLEQDIRQTAKEPINMGISSLTKNVRVRHVGVKQGRIDLNAASSSAMGHLTQLFG